MCYPFNGGEQSSLPRILRTPLRRLPSIAECIYLRRGGSVTGRGRGICKIWYLISRTVSDDDAHRGNIDDRSVRAFAVKPRAFGAPPCGIGA